MQREEPSVYRPHQFLSVIVPVLLGLVVIGATPAAQAGFLAPGLTGEARVTPLFEMTVPATAMPRALVLDVILWRATIDPGIRVVAPADTGDCCPGPQFVHVLAGDLALRVDGPLLVVRAGVDRAPEAGEDVPPGTESVLRPGDSAVVRFELAAEYANLGATPVDFLSGGLFAGFFADPPPIAGYTVTDHTKLYPAPPLPPGPVTYSLAEVTLAPNGMLGAPPVGAPRVAITKSGAGILGQEQGGVLVNIGQKPVSVFVLTLYPRAGAGALMA